jgi:hypothetical protein
MENLPFLTKDSRLVWCSSMTPYQLMQLAGGSTDSSSGGTFNGSGTFTFGGYQGKYVQI